MANIQVVDLTSDLPPIEEPTVISVWYDEGTKEVYTYHAERDDGIYPDLSYLGLVNTVIKKTDEVTRYANEVYSKNYYDIQSQRVLSKPSIVLTPDKSVLIGDGTDVVVVTVECKTFDDKDYPWDCVTIKSITRKDDYGNDIPGIAQTSVGTLVYNPEVGSNQFKVRSSLRGKTQIKVKYAPNADSPTLANGNLSFPFNYAVLDLTVLNSGF